MDNNEVQFNHVFEEWAGQYDATVYDRSGEYHEVFEGYEEILNRVVQSLELPRLSHVLEIGVGTGNLTERLLRKGWNLYGVDPSPEMREIANKKLPDFPVQDGHFLHIPSSIKELNGIVSSYAFHHLTDEQKETSIHYLSGRLLPGGMIVFADTAYADEEAKRAIHERVKRQGAMALLHDLQTEYYPLIGTVRKAFENAGFSFTSQPLNRYVWLMVAKKNR